MNPPTAYTNYEAQVIGSLNWYKDPTLINAIVDLVQRNHSTTLFDLCCGTGQLYPIICQFYTKIYAVDLSPEMIQNSLRNNQRFKEKIVYTCGDAACFMESHLAYFHDDVDFLFKNCMQFLNLPHIVSQFRRIKYNRCFVVNTINKSPWNFFDLLRSLNFDFVNRTQYYFTEELLDEYCSQIGTIKESTCISQCVPLIDWLKYHQCTDCQIDMLINYLSSLTQEDLDKYGLERSTDSYILRRLEKIYCIAHRDTPSTENYASLAG